ncbi:hypothetical protein LNP20_29475 [Klebsiella pneumoniae subsp. pneumoniae]|nr:hypothetical protein [Klebsiella pneumoniae subsp. pneumoniae]
MRHSTMLATAALPPCSPPAPSPPDLPGKGITVKPAQSTISEELPDPAGQSRAGEAGLHRRETQRSGL